MEYDVEVYCKLLLHKTKLDSATLINDDNTQSYLIKLAKPYIYSILKPNPNKQSMDQII